MDLLNYLLLNKANDDIIEHIYEILTEDTDKERKAIEKEITRLKSERSKLKTQKIGYINMKAKELISDEEFIELKKEMDRKLVEIEVELSGIEENLDRYSENIDFTCEILQTLKNKWFTLSQRQKADIFKLLTCERLLGNEKTGKLLITWEKPWDMLELVGKGTLSLPESFFEGSRRNRPRGLCEHGKINRAD